MATTKAPPKSRNKAAAPVKAVAKAVAKAAKSGGALDPYRLPRTVLPVMRRSAEAGSASATQWVERFEALGEKLAVRVGGETDDPESERGDRRIAGEGHIG